MKEEYSNFREFYPSYLDDHRDPAGDVLDNRPRDELPFVGRLREPLAGRAVHEHAVQPLADVPVHQRAVREPLERERRQRVRQVSRGWRCC